jgi:tetratricopeptide (TPR) repeat protein
MWAEASPPRRLVAILAAIALLSLLLPAWRWLSADSIALKAPDRALARVPDHPRALELAAVQAYANGDTEAAEAFARAAIAGRPLESRPYRILAAIYEDSERMPEARAAHAAAIAVAPSDAVARLWLASRLLAEGRFVEALGHIDRGLRARPDLSTAIFPVLAGGLENVDFLDSLVSQLAAAPPWRQAFLDEAVRKAGTIEVVLPLVEGLAESVGLTDREVRLVASHFEHERRWEDLRAAWHRLAMPPGLSEGLVVDGGFERNPHGFGLGWRLSRVPGAIVGFASARGSEDGGRALNIRFLDQRVPFQHVQQRLLLPEGRFRLSGEARADSLRARRGLRWEVRCDERSDLLGAGPLLAGTQGWHAWQVDFAVPAECPSQWLTLRLEAVGPSEQMVGGAAAFDGLSIEPIDDGADAPRPAGASELPGEDRAFNRLRAQCDTDTMLPNSEASSGARGIVS